MKPLIYNDVGYLEFYGRVPTSARKIASSS